jgi:hypothetical protein
VDPEVAPGEPYDGSQEQDRDTDGVGEGKGEGEGYREARSGVTGREAESIGRVDEGPHPHGKLRPGASEGPLQELYEEVGGSQSKGRSESRSLEGLMDPEGQKPRDEDRHRSVPKVRDGSDDQVQTGLSPQDDRMEKAFVELAQSQKPGRHDALFLEVSLPGVRSRSGRPAIPIPALE